tara:strand:+ start:171 stop:809 length:639 start_codon:yes stop_codon:yes gene_type:complete
MVKKKYKDLIVLLADAKVYLGGKKIIWDPIISYYLLGIKNGFCIFDLEKTIFNLKKSLKLITYINNSKKKILFIGFPKEFENKCIQLYNSKGHFYVSNKGWINGILTNNKDFFSFKKKFLLELSTKKIKEKRFFYEKFGGVLNLKNKPDLIVIFNHGKNLDSLREAFSINIPIISFVNSGDSIKYVDYPITGNFNSKKFSKLYYNLIKYALS